MTPDVDAESCRRCWTREDLGLGPCVKHREDPPSRDLLALERVRDAWAEGVHAKETRKPAEANTAALETNPEETAE